MVAFFERSFLPFSPFWHSTNTCSSRAEKYDVPRVLGLAPISPFPFAKSREGRELVPNPLWFSHQTSVHFLVNQLQMIMPTMPKAARTVKATAAKKSPMPNDTMKLSTEAEIRTGMLALTAGAEPMPATIAAE